MAATGSSFILKRYGGKTDAETDDHSSKQCFFRRISFVLYLTLVCSQNTMHLAISILRTQFEHSVICISIFYNENKDFWLRIYSISRIPIPLYKCCRLHKPALRSMELTLNMQQNGCYFIDDKRGAWVSPTNFKPNK